jgi:hypothetical protein
MGFMDANSINDITLSLPYDLTDKQWSVVAEVFRGMQGWIGDTETDNIPQWYGVEGSERYILASVEPSGLLLVGNLPARDWMGWISVLCARLSLRLGIEVRDAEM